MDDIITIVEQNFVDLNSPVVTPHQPSPAHVPLHSSPAPVPAPPAASGAPIVRQESRPPPPPRPPPPSLPPKPVTVAQTEANLLNLSLEEDAALTSVSDQSQTQSQRKSDPLVELLTADFASAATASTLVDSSTTGPSPLKPMAAPSIPRPASSSSLNGNGAPFSVAPKQPHYARSFFADLEPKPTTAAAAGVNPKVTADHFEDLLQGFTKTASNASTKLAELKKQELLENGSLDPVSLKVREWKEKKTGNVRALIGSLHSVIWPECKVSPKRNSPDDVTDVLS